MFTVAVLIVLAFICVGIAAYYYHRPTLYDRLGGVFAISAIVNDFSDELVKNLTADKDQLPGLKFMRTLWLCAVTGGPFEYSPAHSDLHISSAEFDEVARVLAQTLDKFKVPPKEKSEVLAVFAAHKKLKK